MLAYSDKLTRSPSTLSDRDLEGLRDEGLRDDEILALVLLAGFFQLATRVADALGVELDSQFLSGTPEYDEFMAGGP